MQKWTIIDFDYKRVCSSFLFDTVIAMMSFVSWDVEQSRKNHQRADECQHPFSQPYFHGIILYFLEIKTYLRTIYSISAKSISPDTVPLSETII